MEMYQNWPLTFDLHLDGFHISIWTLNYYQDSYHTIPQLDTPAWSYNFMYYGIV